MHNIDLTNAKKEHIIIRVKPNGDIEAWTSPRGVRSDRPDGWWTPNPNKANKYRDLTAAIKAAEQLADKYFSKTDSISFLSFDDFAENNVRKEFNSIGEIIDYNPNIRTIYVLEHEGKSTFYQSEDDRQESIHSNVGYDCYELKRVK